MTFRSLFANLLTSAAPQPATTWFQRKWSAPDATGRDASSTTGSALEGGRGGLFDALRFAQKFSQPVPEAQLTVNRPPILATPTETATSLKKLFQKGGIGNGNNGNGNGNGESTQPIAAEPAPKPDIVTAPEPAPLPDTSQKPAPQPALDTIQSPEPAPETNTAVKAVPETNTAVEPAPETNTAVEPAPETNTAVEPAPAPQPEPDIVTAPAPAPDSSQKPAPAPEPAPEPEVAARTSGEPVALTDGATVAVAGGRVTTFALEDAASIKGIEITAYPDAGNVTVNPDMTLSLVLSGTTHTGPLSFSYAITHADGSVTTHSASLSVAAPTQAAGWALGDSLYMLATDANDDVIIETGDNHRKVYVSGSEDALTKADIAALEGLTVDQITTKWLLANPEYGGSEGMALATDVGMELWSGLGSGSNWLLFERGYTYEGAGRLIKNGLQGESELAPIHVTSWGEGERPVISDQVRIYQKASHNIVFTDIAFTGGVTNLSGHNLIFEDVELTRNGFNVNSVSGFTLRDSEVMHVVKQEQLDGDYWTGTKAGMFIKGTEGILLENNFIHHNGWMDDYLPDGSVAGGAPPNMFSHNIYLQNDTTDVVVRDNIFSQASSFGAHIRGGGFVEGNLFLDNNVAVDFLGGDYRGAGPIGHFTLFADNLVTSAGYKDAPKIGAKDWGIRNDARDTTLIDNIVAHKADPNNPDEMAAKKLTKADPASDMYAPYYDDTVIYNWNTKFNANLGGLTAAELNKITIQNFALQYLGIDPADAPANEVMPGYYKSGLLTALLDYLEENGGTDAISAQEIIDWFQAGFGIEGNGNGSATTHRFIPNDLGDGVRWDNRLNWSTGETPTDGDDIDLGGNWVQFAATTIRVDDLALGTNGKLQVSSGKLSVNGDLTVGEKGGAILIEKAGQFWTEGHADDDLLNIQVSGGRFANTGDMIGTTAIKVTGGQAILGMDDASLHLDAGDALWIEGSSAKVGFDGGANGIATLEMEDGSDLTFVADIYGTSAIREFRSGFWDQSGTNVRSGVRLDGDLAIDLSAHGGTAGKLTLIEVDAITGHFDTAKIHGLSSTLNAELVVDYDADLVYLNLTAGTGKVTSRTIGTDSGAGEDAALWADLTAGHALDGEAMTILAVDVPLVTMADIGFF